MAGRAAEEAGDEVAAAEAYALYLFDHAGETYGDEAAVRLARYEGGPEAEERLVQLLAASPGSELVPQAHHDLAERLADRGEWASAREHYAAVVENHPLHVLEPPARYGLAWCLFSEEQFAESLGHLENLAARGEGTNGGSTGLVADQELRMAALELAVWAARRAGEPDRARAAFTSYSEMVPDETRRLRAARVAAAALKDADRIPDAEALLFELLGRTRDRAVAVGICVECTYLALDRNDVAAAEAQARAAYRYTPDDASLAEAFFFVGEAHFEAGADEEAAACYSIAAEAADADVSSRALYKGGFAHLRRDEYDAAGRCFHRLVTEHEKSDLFGESLFLLGASHFRAGRYAQAVEWLERTRKEAPEHAVMPRALYRLGVAQARTERWRDSAETLSLLAREHTEFEHLVEADLWRGRALAGLDQRRGARAAFERVIEKDRGLLAAQAHIELGRLSLAAGDRDEALSKFLYVAVLFAHPDEVSEALFMAGQILETKGDMKQAADRYREAVTQFPDTDFTRRAKARLAEIEK
jgi:TolA-binding protein